METRPERVWSAVCAQDYVQLYKHGTTCVILCDYHFSVATSLVPPGCRAVGHWEWVQEPGEQRWKWLK